MNPDEMITFTVSSGSETCVAARYNTFTTAAIQVTRTVPASRLEDALVEAQRFVDKLYAARWPAELARHLDHVAEAKSASAGRELESRPAGTSRTEAQERARALREEHEATMRKRSGSR